MAIQLYKPGNNHVVQGVPCEVKNFDIAELDYQLKQGWFRVPGEWDQVETEAEEPETTKAPENEPVGNNDPNHPVRISAKAAGIDGWDTKRIATLEKQLNGAEE